MQPDILTKITDSILNDEKENFEQFNLNKVDLLSRPKPISFDKRLEEKNIDFILIAEIKKASPSKGIIRESFNHLEIARAYIDSDVGAISILTEKNFFLGEKNFLQEIRAITDTPLLRKDFILHPYQVFETYNLGADFILLIAACLKDDQLKLLYDQSLKLGLTPLVEIHDESELNRVLKLNPSLIGINNRNLKTFEVDMQTSLTLIKQIPKTTSVVSESGISSAEDIQVLKENGFKGALIGESLLKQKNLLEAVKKLKI